MGDGRPGGHRAQHEEADVERMMTIYGMAIERLPAGEASDV